MRLKQGLKLSEVTSDISQALGLKAKILPMTDDQFETHIVTREGKMHFEEYLVKRGAKEAVLSVEYYGAATAKPADGVLTAIEEAELVLVCPSNPIVSISTILSVKGIRDALRRSTARKVAISPIIAGAPVKGPADKLMKGLGLEVSAFSVAKLYADFLDTFILDSLDVAEKERIEQLGIGVKVMDTIMRSLEDKVRLATYVLGK
jgi:LPPG:FO 2-phospho-L-lactate transferase